MIQRDTIHVTAEAETGLAQDDITLEAVMRRMAYRMGENMGRKMAEGLVNRRDIPIESTGRIVERPKALIDDHANRG